MVQEIITYLIIVIAIGLAVFKIFKKLKRKKLLQSVDKKSGSSTSQSACSACLAECILRDVPSKFKNENEQLCERSLENVKCS
jgi:uncharacterized membrane protein YraQ (UPF0718 family)